MNKTINYNITSIKDNEDNPITIKVCDFNKSNCASAYQLPKYISIIQENYTLNIFSDRFSDLGFHTIIVGIFDGEPSSSNKTFQLEIYNTAPYFITNPLDNLNIRFNNTFEYILPYSMDNESNPIYTYLHKNSSSFV